MSDVKEILKKRLIKLEKHYLTLKEYKSLINTLVIEQNIYHPDVFNALAPEKRAIVDAYLKRFSAIQDFLGAKIFSLLLEIAGIDGSKMSEVLYHVEKEGIIDSLEQWIELREIRNELEHDYPEDLEAALEDLKFFIDHFKTLETYFHNVTSFAKRYGV